MSVFDARLPRDGHVGTGITVSVRIPWALARKLPHAGKPALIYVMQMRRVVDRGVEIGRRVEICSAGGIGASG